MSCDRNSKAATAAAQANGITSQSSQMAQVEPDKKANGLLGDKNLRRLTNLKASGDAVSGDDLTKLFRLRAKQKLDHSPAVTDRFGERAWLAVGKNTSGVVFDAGNDYYSVGEVFVPARSNGHQPAANLQRLIDLRDSEQGISAEEVARLLEMKPEQKIEVPPGIKSRFGEMARLAVGKETIGILFDRGNDYYGIQEVLIPAAQHDHNSTKPVKEKSQDALKVNTRARIAVNTQRVQQAIKDKKKMIILYDTPNKGVRRYALIPLDVAPGKTEETKHNKYLWCYAENARTVISMRMDKVLWSKPGNDTFDSDEVLQATLNGRSHTWTLPREW